MKILKEEKTKSNKMKSSGIIKKLRRVSRVQLLVTAMLIAGIGLLLLLLQDDTPELRDGTASQARINSSESESRGDNKKEPVTIGVNRPPVIISVALYPNMVLPGIPVRADVKASDPDQDDLSINYIWQVNGQISDQIGEEFDTSNLRKGDMITVSVIPDDGKEPGRLLESNGVLIQNRPPEITSMPGAGVSRGFFQYQVLANDPDNDILEYSLEGAPADMSIDANGLIQWTVPQGLQGKQQVRVIVSDGTASSFQSFNLNLGETTVQ